MMNMYTGMMGAAGGSVMILSWVTWVLLIGLLVAAIRWLWKEADRK